MVTIKFPTPEEILEAYGDYRESIGRDRVNTLEDLKQSIPFGHFQAGIKYALQYSQSDSSPELSAEDYL